MGDAEELAADPDEDEEDSSEDDAEDLAADEDEDEEDSSEDDAEELAADPDEDEQDSLVDSLLLNRALRGSAVPLSDMDFATIGAAKKKAAKKKKEPKKKKAKAKKAPKKKKKAKKVSKIGKGKMAKYLVFKGTKVKTVGGLRKADLMKSKSGKIVSKKGSAAGKKRYKNIAGWVAAVAKARKALGTKGFVAIKKGSPLYVKAKSFYKRRVYRSRSMLLDQLKP